MAKILNFADDAKCYKIIHNALDMASLQLDLNSLTEWSTNNQLPFNINKCSNFTIKLSPYMIIFFLSNLNTVIWALYFQPVLTGHHIMKLL